MWKYDGNAALESFVEVSDNMREATCVWRDLAPSGRAWCTMRTDSRRSPERNTKVPV